MAIGHALVGIVVVIAVLLGLTLPLALIRWLVAAMLVALEIFLFAAPAAGQIPARHHLLTTVTLLGGLVATALRHRRVSRGHRTHRVGGGCSCCYGRNHAHDVKLFCAQADEPMRRSTILRSGGENHVHVWIDRIQRRQSEVRAVYDDIMATRKTDWINNFWKAIAHDPALLKRTWEDIKEIMAPGAIDPLTKELIYVAVSVTNNCHYCIASHTASAVKKGMTRPCSRNCRQSSAWPTKPTSWSPATKSRSTNSSNCPSDLRSKTPPKKRSAHGSSLSQPLTEHDRSRNRGSLP